MFRFFHKLVKKDFFITPTILFFWLLELIICRYL
jgi:hypothetical protein